MSTDVKSLLGEPAALDPLLQRQLRRAGIVAAVGPQTPTEWEALLRAVNEHYLHSNQDRELMNRTLEMSSNEAEHLRSRVEGERDRLLAMVAAIGEALGHFGELLHEDTNSASQVAAAKSRFAAQLQTILRDSRINDHTNEVSVIRTNMVRLADQLLAVLSAARDRASVRKELEVAGAVQQLLVPGHSEIERAGIRVVGYCEPAAECGGDWWTFEDLANQRVLTMSGDVSGHGASAAIITGVAKAACDLAIEVTQGQISAGDLLGLMNATLFRVARRQLMMTCVATVFEPATRTLTVANAGHPFPILIRSGVIHPLIAEGSPLGAAAVSNYAPITVQAEIGDVMVCFTDGIVEAENRQGEQFTEKRLRAVAQRAAASGAVAVRDAIVTAVNMFRDNQPASDDMSFVVLSIL